jgi:hypothetical protein
MKNLVNVPKPANGKISEIKSLALRQKTTRLFIILLCFSILAMWGCRYTTNLASVTQTAAAGQNQTAIAAALNQAVQQTQAAGNAQAVDSTALAATALTQGDDDGDGLSNSQELALGTDPKNPDTDGDGLPDGVEVNQYSTDPKNKDTDGDTLTDGREVNDLHTSPKNPDSDGDSLNDGIEITAGSNPLSVDSDGDGIPDGSDSDPIHTSTPVPDVGATAQAIVAQTAAAQTLAAQQTGVSAAATSQAATSAAKTAQMAATLTAQAQFRIAYIYKSDLALANTYKTFLESNSYKVDIIKSNNVASTNYAPYRLIIIGPDTGNPASWTTGPWGDPAGSEAGYIDTFNKPIIGLGTGGSLFFEARNLYLGFGHCWISTTGDTSVHVENASNRIWTTPNSISIPASQLLMIYDNNSPFPALFLPGPISGIVALGRQSDNNEHYVISMQNGKYLLWGFENGPSDMSGKGKKVFLNAINMLTSPLLIPGSILITLVPLITP